MVRFDGRTIYQYWQWYENVLEYISNQCDCNKIDEESGHFSNS